MQHLIPMTRTEIGKATVPTVNARDLHEFLEVQTRFNDWIERRIEEYDFEEDKDFCYSYLSSKTAEDDFYSNLSKSRSKIGRPSKDYHLSVDMAKELSMVERNAKGKQARQYFIECERIAHTMRIEAPTRIDAGDPATIIAAIRAETSYAVQVMLHKQLRQCCRQRRLPLPSLMEIANGGELTPAHLFWQAILTIGRQARIQLNHSCDPARRAYEYSRVRHWAKRVGCKLPPKSELIQSLKHDRRFLGEKTIPSKLRRQQPVRCWVFRRHLDEGKRRGR